MTIFQKESFDKINEIQESIKPRYTVMVVDDKESNLGVMSGILKADYHVIEARDGQEALALIEKMENLDLFACIISDYRMPQMNGVELLEKAQLFAPHASRIIVSGFIDIDAIVDSINRGGICKFIVKPFEMNNFLEAAKCGVQLFESYAEQVAETQTLHKRISELEKK